MNLFKIALCNIKKRLAASVTFTAITMLAAFIFTVSMSLFLNATSFYDKKREELDTPELSVIIAAAQWNEDFLTYAQNYPGVTRAEAVDALGAQARVNVNGSDSNALLMLFDARVPRTIAPLKIAEGAYPTAGAVLPLNYKYAGLKVGGVFEFTAGGVKREYKIDGFYEDAETGNALTVLKAVYLAGGAFDALTSANAGLSFFKYMPLKIDKGKVDNFLSDFPHALESFTYESSKTTATAFALILAGMMTVVALTILAIALIIARFNIVNSIEEDAKNIGSLKSVGYTSAQVIKTVLMQFTFLAALGTLLGIIFAAAASSTVGNIVSATAGLKWGSPSLLIPALISVAAVTLTTFLTAYFLAKKSGKITPVSALREGFGGGGIKKNRVPLDTARVPLNLAMGLKNFFAWFKNALVAAVIITLFGFLSVLTAVMHYNMIQDTTAFVTMVGVESNDVMVIALDTARLPDIAEELRAGPQARKILLIGNHSFSVNGRRADLNVWEDVTAREANTLVSGRYPQSADEISLPASLKTALNKKIGDTVAFTYGGVTAKFKITGITQGAGSGNACDLTDAGFARFNGGSGLTSVYVYLKEDAAIHGYIDYLTDTYGGAIMVSNFREQADSIFKSIESPVNIAVYTVVTMAVFTICFVMYLLISTVIRRGRRTLGILKALGYTNRRLSLQIFYSLLPSIIIGALLGLITGITLANPMLGIFFKGLGIAQARFAIPLWQVALSSLAIAALASGAVLLVTLKARAVSPRKLITE